MLYRSLLVLPARLGEDGWQSVRVLPQLKGAADSLACSPFDSYFLRSAQSADLKFEGFVDRQALINDVVALGGSLKLDIAVEG